ncbi:MAG TPA: hypothetical protein VFS42_01210 [Burkholderiaceae bacterium]|nr:hypothetical protein [Burkholderiaceae bacterium]
MAAWARCRARTVHTTDAFTDWIRRDVRPFFPHEFFVAAYGRITGNTFDVKVLIPVGCPPPLAEALERRALLHRYGMFSRWIVEREPILIHDRSTLNQLAPDERDDIETFNLLGLVVHGFVDRDSGLASYFCFARVPQPLYALHERKAWVMAATVHTNLTSVAARMTDPAASTLAIARSLRS